MLKRYVINGNKYVAKSRRDAAEMWGKENSADFQHGDGVLVKVEHNKRSVQMLVSCVVSKLFIARPKKGEIDA